MLSESDNNSYYVYIHSYKTAAGFYIIKLTNDDKQKLPNTFVDLLLLENSCVDIYYFHRKIMYADFHYNMQI